MGAVRQAVWNRCSCTSANLAPTPYSCKAYCAHAPHPLMRPVVASTLPILHADGHTPQQSSLSPASKADPLTRAALLQGGRMSQFLERMKVGETTDFKGPLGHFIYTGPGEYLSHGKPGKVTHLSMIAGGTGITPMYQIIQVGTLPCQTWGSWTPAAGCQGVASQGK